MLALDIGVNFYDPNPTIRTEVVLTRITYIQPYQETHGTFSRGANTAYPVSRRLTEVDRRTLCRAQRVLVNSLWALTDVLNQPFCTGIIFSVRNTVRYIHLLFFLLNSKCVHEQQLLAQVILIPTMELIQVSTGHDGSFLFLNKQNINKLMHYLDLSF